MSRIMDLDPNVCDNVIVGFYTESWEEFDRAARWLVKQGVRLTRFDADLNSVPLIVQGSLVKWNGKLANIPLGSGGIVFSGEEGGVDYKLMTPSFIRM